MSKNSEMSDDHNILATRVKNFRAIWKNFSKITSSSCELEQLYLSAVESVRNIKHKVWTVRVYVSKWSLKFMSKSLSHSISTCAYAESLDYYTCQRCGRKYKVLYTLVRHMRYECGVGKMFVCSTCSRRFARLDMMRAYQKNTGHQIAPYIRDRYLKWVFLLFVFALTKSWIFYSDFIKVNLVSCLLHI